VSGARRPGRSALLEPYREPLGGVAGGVCGVADGGVVGVESDGGIVRGDADGARSPGRSPTRSVEDSPQPATNVASSASAKNPLSTFCI
jgi:hypothetical protein